MRKVHRPGYFGRRRDAIVQSYNRTYGEGYWELRWFNPYHPKGLTFNDACVHFYEKAYYLWLAEHPEDVDYICSFEECIDNAITNIESGCDYMKQEAFSTHIQDIAVRNVLRTLGRKFEGSGILTIRSADSNGHKYGPGNIPYYNLQHLEVPSLCPNWANPGSVEDFWQSNKWLVVK